MRNLLNDALSLLDDRHIEEAATYTPKAKTINLKKILPLAACFVLVIVSAFAAKEYLSPHITPTQTTVFSDPHTTTNCGVIPPENNSTTVAGVADGSTTVAHIFEGTSTTMPTTTSADITESTTTQTCPPQYASWKDAPLYETTPSITFNNKLYVTVLNANHTSLFDHSKIKGVLKENTITGYSQGYKAVPVAVSICEIDGVNSEYAIAVIRNDGLQRGYNIYINKELLYDCKDFNEILEKLDYKNNLILADNYVSITPPLQISYYKKNPFDYIAENVFDIYTGATERFNFEDIYQQAINKSFLAMFEKKDTVEVEYLKGADINSYQLYKEDCLEFTAYICGYLMEVRFTEEGKLYFWVINGSIDVVCYNFSKSDFDYFLSCCFNPQPDFPALENVLRSGLGTSQTLSDVISFADITTEYNPQNFCTEFRAYYTQDGKEDITYSISIQTMEELASLIINNREVKSEERTSNTGEKLTFNAYLKEYPCEIHLCNDGYLYFCADGLTRAFNIGVENYEKFINTFTHVIWTPENPVTMG